MNRKEFMEKLEGLLAGIPADERGEALQYYTDYFEDAGSENEEQVIRELGSPEKVASTIWADLKGGSNDSGEFTENGYRDARFEKKENPAHRGYAYNKAESGYTYRDPEAKKANGGDSYEEYGSSEPPRTSRMLKILLVILIVLAAVPFAIPAAIGILCAVLGIVCAAFGLFAGFVIGAVALMVVGISIFVLGLCKLLVALPVALLTSGSGLIIFVIGLIATVASVKLCMVIWPAMFRILVNICRWPFHRKVVS